MMGEVEEIPPMEGERAEAILETRLRREEEEEIAIRLIL